MRPEKHPCGNPSEWRLPPGKPPERLPPYYQIACDFGTSLMLSLKDARRNEPIYLCATHAAEIAPSAAANTRGIQSSESAPAGIRSGDPAAHSPSVPPAQQNRRYLYILLLVAILALAGGLFGPGLFRAIRPRSSKTAGTAEARKKTESRALSEKAVRKALPAAPLKRAEAVPTRKTQLAKQSLQTAPVAVGGSVARRILPDVPKSASDTIQGTILVSVKAQVDASGNVAGTELVFPGPSRYFARLAVESAQRWKFHPPVVAGQGSPSEWIIRFYYTREATKAFATEDVPGAGAGKPQK